MGFPPINLQNKIVFPQENWSTLIYKWRIVHLFDWRVTNKVGRFTPNKMDWYIDIHSGFRNAGCFTWNFLDIYHTNKVRCLKARVTNKVERLRQSNQQSKISPFSHIKSPSFAGLCSFTIQYHPVIKRGNGNPHLVRACSLGVQSRLQMCTV
jgi:hypothetical protein